MARRDGMNSRPNSRLRPVEGFGPSVRDEVNEPLGRNSPAPSRAAGLVKRFGPRLALGLAAVAVGLAALTIVKSDNRSGGEPFAVARIEQAPPAPPSPAAPPAAAALPATATGDQVDAASGVKVVRKRRRRVRRADHRRAAGAGRASSRRARPAPRRKIALRPAAAHRRGRGAARRRLRAAGHRLGAAAAGAPRVAIIIGGLGLNAEGTANAIARLPGAVSLGFAPYGGDLEREVAAARAAGHEILLQAPMESFAYPRTIPARTRCSPAPRKAKISIRCTG